MSLIPPGRNLFVVDLRYLVPFDQVEPVVAAHMAFVKAQYDAGVFLLSGPKVPRTGGIVLALAESKAALEAILAADPFLTEGVAECLLTEFRPTNRAPGFGGEA